jgi:hypothetical protein
LPRDLSQSVVVITGASSGIGCAAARAFAREGARLVLAARTPEPLRGLAEELERTGATAVAIPTDVRDEAAVWALARAAVDRFGALDDSGRAVRPVPPMADPEEVADGIVRCARSPSREVTYKRTGRALELLHSLAPGLYGRILPSAFEAANYGRRAMAPGLRHG